MFRQISADLRQTNLIWIFNILLLPLFSPKWETFSPKYCTLERKFFGQAKIWWKGTVGPVLLPRRYCMDCVSE